MTDPMVDQMTRLQLKLLERRLENERGYRDERGNSAYSTRSYDGQTDALHNALRRKADLLKKLKEQYMLEELVRPHTWGGVHQQHYYTPLPLHVAPADPLHIYPPAPAAPPPPPPPPPPPRIIQQTLPQQPATIIQQLPQQQPLIAQIPPPPLAGQHRSGSIKEDMVELMLMQNAQMHQIIMHNMMLKALPPMAFSPGAASGHAAFRSPPSGQENYVKTRGSAIHHHHHYGAPALPPIGYQVWPSGTSTGRVGAGQPSIQHLTAPLTLPPLNTVTIDGMKSKVPFGL